MKVLKEILGWLGTITFSVAIALLINLFICRPSEVLGSSMEPTLNEGDIKLISKIDYALKKEPTYGDIVIIDSRVNHKHTIKDDLVDTFKYNIISGMLFKNQNHTYWIKRVIGKPGDTLEFKNSKVYRNGKELDEPYIKEPMNYTSSTGIVVPPKHVFVMGDNRNWSSDSRDIGSVPYENVVGKLMFQPK